MYNELKAKTSSVKNHTDAECSKNNDLRKRIQGKNCYKQSEKRLIIFLKEVINTFFNIY